MRNRKLLDFPRDENGDVLRQMDEAGDDLSLPRSIDFVHLFAGKEAAQCFSGQAREAGYDVSLYEPHEASGEGASWAVICSWDMLPTHGEITRVEQELAELAKSFGGRGDGWACTHQPETPT